MRLGLIILLLIITCTWVWADGTMVDSIEANPPDGCVLAMTFDEGPGAKDWSSIGNSTSVSNAVWVSTGVFDFDGTNDSISILSDPSFHFDRTDDYTMALWFKASAQKASSYNIMLCLRTSGGAHPGMILLNTTDTLQLSTWNGSSGIDSVITGTYSDEKWYHVVFLHHTNSTFNCYLNGEYKSVSGTESGSTANNEGANVGGNDVAFGGGADGLRGLIKDVYIYHYALSATEIKELYERGKEKLQ